jgi:hypothetical protein
VVKYRPQADSPDGPTTTGPDAVPVLVMIIFRVPVNCHSRLSAAGDLTDGGPCGSRGRASFGKTGGGERQGRHGDRGERALDESRHESLLG